MLAVDDNNVLSQSYCIRTFPNNQRTYGSSSTYFINADGTVGNFGNCQQEDDDGETPPANLTYPPFVSMDTVGAISLSDPIAPSNNVASYNFDYSENLALTSYNFTFHFSC